MEAPAKLAFLHHGVAPSPAPGAGVVRLGAAGYFCDDETIRCAEFRCYFDLSDIRLRQHAGGMLRNRRARQRDIDEFLVLEWKLCALDLSVRARAGQALREMTPVRRRERTLAVMRAGGNDMRARRDQLPPHRDDPGIARRSEEHTS